jgi:hypothetical protein
LTAWSLSPEGARIAFPEKGGLRVIDLRNGAGREIAVSLPALYPPVWAADGAALFASTGYTIVRIELDGKTHVLLDRHKNQFLESIRPSPDGHYLAFSQETFQSNIWMLQNFDSSEEFAGKLRFWPFAK